MKYKMLRFKAFFCSALKLHYNTILSSVPYLEYILDTERAYNTLMYQAKISLLSQALHFLDLAIEPSIL